MAILIAKDWCCTQRKMEKHSFIWTLKQFSILCTIPISVESSLFPSGSQFETKWRMQLESKWQEKSNCISQQGQPHSGFTFGGYASTANESRRSSNTNNPVKEWCTHFNLMLCSDQIMPLWVTGEFSILDSEKTKKIRKWNIDHYIPDRKTTSFVVSNNLANEPSDLLSEDELILYCEISVTRPVVVTGVDGPIEVTDSQIDDAVNAASLLENPNFSDVLLCAGKIEFPAHKSILVCRSPVFEAMFSHDMEEKKQNRVVIEDIEPEVFRQLLRYIYTGRVDLPHETAVKLLPAADKYDLKKLKTKCEEHLAANLTNETAVHSLLLADRHSAVHLKERSLQFICTNRKDILDTESWNFMKNERPQLFEDCFKMLSLQLV